MNSRKLFALPLAFVGGVLLPMFSGCVESDPGHCLNNGGDAYCGEGKYCTNNCGGDYDVQGCLAAEEPPADGCWACNGSGDSNNCGSVGDGDGDSTDSDTTMDTDSTDDATETMDTDTTAETGPECMDSSECPGEMPLCEDGACVGCGDAVVVTCDSEYPEAPACDAGSGECVECTGEDLSACSAGEPACEGGECVPCDEHEQCPDSACNMATGACMDPDRVWWVNQMANMGGDGSEEMPFQTIASATAMVGDGESGTIYVATPNLHQEYVPIFTGQIVALLGKSDIGSIAFQGAATVDINAGASVFIHRMRIAGGGNVGVDCDGCSLWITDSRIVDNDGGGIVSQDGILKIRNSFVGGVALDAPVLSVDAGELDVNYATLAGGGSNSASLICQNGAVVVVRNSLMVSLQVGSEVSCMGAMISSSALEMASPGNVELGSMADNTWFVSYNAGDFHLTPAAPTEIAEAAVWESGDPSFDIDGDPRPLTGGSVDYAGADIPN